MAEINAEPRVLAIRPALLMTPEKFPARIIVPWGPFSDITPVLMMLPDRLEIVPVNGDAASTKMPPIVPLLMMLPVTVVPCVRLMKVSVTPELTIFPVSRVRNTEILGTWGMPRVIVPSFVISPTILRPLASMHEMVVEAGLLKPVAPARSHAAWAAFPPPPIMSAASELDDNNERTRAQGIIKNHLSRGEQVQS
jgi:hypothetical protein